jgi:hypothetical protein
MFIFSAVGCFSYFSSSSVLTAKSEQAIKAEIHTVSALLQLQYDSLLAIAKRNASVFKDMYAGELIKSSDSVLVVDKMAPILLHNNKIVNNNIDIVEEYAKLTGGNATVFVRDGDDFLRITTSLKKSDGSRAIGTYLGKKHPGYQSLINGESFEGYAKLFGNEYMTVYNPIKNNQNQVIGILYIGFNINESLASLRHTIDKITLEENGYLVIYKNSNNEVIASKDMQSNPTVSASYLNGLNLNDIQNKQTFAYVSNQHTNIYL